MKNIVMVGPKTSKIVDIPNVEPNDDQLLIKIKYVGVCRSEHYAWAHAKGGEAFGHEPMGIVEKVGKNVKGFAVGDRVSGMWSGAQPGTGNMVEYALAQPPQDVVIKLPDHIRDVDLIVEPLSCIFSAVSKAKVEMPGTKVAVVGCGYMGCGAISALKLRGAYVVAIDLRKECLQEAKRYGADEIYTVEEAEEKFINSDFRGFEVVMEWGLNSDSLGLAVNLIAPCAQLCVAAYHAGEKRMVDMARLGSWAAEVLNTHPVDRPRTVKAAHNAIEMLASGAWDFRDLPVKVYPRSKFDLAQAELETKYGSHMKSVIDMTWEDGEPYVL